MARRTMQPIETEGQRETNLKLKVLFVCHNHPSLFPGGAEMYALELYQTMRDAGTIEPIFLARIGSSALVRHQPHFGTPFSSVNGDGNQYFFHTDVAGFDFLNMTLRDKQAYTKHFRQFLLAHQPDVVHFQHTLFLGFDLIRQTRNTLPDAAILYTLHEYGAICHHDGQMLRTRSHELCGGASPRRCHECFPNVSPQDFYLRQRFIQSHLALVDQFIAPSRFLVEKYAEWGIPREKLRYEENGRQLSDAIPEELEDRPRTRFGFFGQLSMFKGVNVLLEAAKILYAENERARSPIELAREDTHEAVPPSDERRTIINDTHVWIHGANLEIQPQAFQDEFAALFGETQEHVTLAGRYEHKDLPALMRSVDWVVIPSIWWENSPLVIQEAFKYGRPVICSDIGGMAEKVTNNVNGLHFRARNAVSLAETMRRAVETPGLWEQLRRGIPEVRSMADHADTLTKMYQSILCAKRSEG